MTVWWHNNPDKALQQRRDYEEANRLELNRKRRAYRKGKPEIMQGQWLRQTYGVTLEWYEAKLAEQGGGCAIC
jgi:hypothetical protein